MELIKPNKTRKKPKKNVTSSVKMTDKTKVFIQKICYKQTASVDMTKYGFVSDLQHYHLKFLLKPLTDQLDKIWGTHPAKDKLKSSMKKYNNKGKSIPRQCLSAPGDMNKPEAKKQNKVKFQNLQVAA